MQASLEVPLALSHSWMTMSDVLPFSAADEAHLSKVTKASRIAHPHPNHVPERASEVVLEGQWRHPTWRWPTRFTSTWNVLVDFPVPCGWSRDPSRLTVETVAPPDDTFEQYGTPDRLAGRLGSRLVIPPSG